MNINIKDFIRIGILCLFFNDPSILEYIFLAIDFFIVNLARKKIDMVIMKKVLKTIKKTKIVYAKVNILACID